MAYKPTQNKNIPVDPLQLNHADFRWFIMHFPAILLKEAKIQRPTFVAVGMVLAQFGDYKTGTKINPSAKALHNLTGAHPDTIRKIIAVLTATNALEITEHHQGKNGGQPYPVYRFRKSPEVARVLAKRDAKEWTKRASATGESASAIGEPGSATGESASSTGEDNRNIMNTMNRKNGSDESSPVPAALSPSVGNESEEDFELDLDEPLSDEKSPEDYFWELANEGRRQVGDVHG